MKKLFLKILVLSLLFSGNASAEWVPIFMPSDEYYVENTKITTKDSNVKTWLLINLKKPVESNKGNIYSFISFVEYDCLNSKTRTLQLYSYAGQMGNGNLISSSQPNEWKYPAPGSNLSFIQLKLCSKDYIDLLVNN